MSNSHDYASIKLSLISLRPIGSAVFNNLTNYQKKLTYLYQLTLYFDADQMSWFARICVFVNSSVHPKLMFGEIGVSIQHPSCQHNTIGLSAASTNYTVLCLLFKM